MQEMVHPSIDYAITAFSETFEVMIMSLFGQIFLGSIALLSLFHPSPCNIILQLSRHHNVWTLLANTTLSFSLLPSNYLLSYEEYISLLLFITLDYKDISLKMSIVLQLYYHSSQFHSLCLTKSSSETLQNLPYFIYTKTQSCFFHFSFSATLLFP